MKNNDLAGKVALITGGARGIGKACAKLLAEHGAQVILADINAILAEQSAEELMGLGFKAGAAALDVSDHESVAACFASVVQAYGSLDILVNSAGILSPYTVETMPLEHWDKVLDINLKGVFLCCREALRYMKRQNGGKIVNIASMAGEVGAKLAGPDYSASKAGVINLTKVIARNGAANNINCNSVCPGLIATDMTRERGDTADDIPLGRLGTPEDVAGSIYFLSSALSDYVTGANLSVNGGMQMLG